MRNIVYHETQTLGLGDPNHLAPALHVSRASWQTKATLTLGQNSISNLPGSGQEKTGKNLPGDAQKPNATIAVAAPAIALCNGHDRTNMKNAETKEAPRNL